MIRGFLDAGGVRGMGVRAWNNLGIWLLRMKCMGFASCIIWKKNRRPRRRGLRRQPFGLAPGLSHSVPLAARSDQSLSLTYVRDLLPQPLCGRIKRWAILFGNAKAAAAAARR